MSKFFNKTNRIKRILRGLFKLTQWLFWPWLGWPNNYRTRETIFDNHWGKGNNKWIQTGNMQSELFRNLKRTKTRQFKI